MELKELLNKMQNLLYTITNSRKGSIGTINNVYICQLDRKRCDSLSIEVQRHLTSAVPDSEDGAIWMWPCPKCGRGWKIKANAIECCQRSISVGGGNPR